MENIETLLAAVAQTTGFGDEDPVVATPSDLKTSASPVRSSPAVVAPDLTAAAPASAVCEKRKRGRPPKGQLKVKPPPIKKVKVEVEDEDEDVCFICFDGGSLVLCDRKGCPKAYHPTCIKRDEAFFKSKAKWICGTFSLVSFKELKLNVVLKFYTATYLYNYTFYFGCGAMQLVGKPMLACVPNDALDTD